MRPRQSGTATPRQWAGRAPPQTPGHPTGPWSSESPRASRSPAARGTCPATPSSSPPKRRPRCCGGGAPGPPSRCCRLRRWAPATTPRRCVAVGSAAARAKGVGAAGPSSGPARVRATSGTRPGPRDLARRKPRSAIPAARRRGSRAPASTPYAGPGSASTSSGAGQCRGGPGGRGGRVARGSGPGAPRWRSAGVPRPLLRRQWPGPGAMTGSRVGPPDGGQAQARRRGCRGAEAPWGCRE